MKSVQLSSMTKITENEELNYKEFNAFSALNNERFAYQVTVFNGSEEETEAHISVKSDLDEVIEVNQIGYVYLNRPLLRSTEFLDTYKMTEPGYMPDPLFPIENDKVLLKAKKNNSFFITIDLSKKKFDQGFYPIVFELETKNEKITKTFTLEVIGKSLPVQTLIYTNWFHCDSIAQTHNVPVFSEDFWVLVEKYMLAASRIGINMILTPLFTPPLDTVVDGERQTVQLVDVEKIGDKYVFEFSKLYRWIALAKKCGMKYFEMSHLFTQWGARCTPKIVVKVDGKEEKLFGWHVPATDERYKDFLSQFLPALVKVIEKAGITKKTFFHLSDEPGDEDTKARYVECKNMMLPYIKGFEIMDALSNPSYYEQGVSNYPIPSTCAVDQFLNYKLKKRWTYYCCGEYVNASNRFTSMHGWNTRALGSQLFKYDIKGFLHWGFNHYFSILSRELVDPYNKNDKDNFPTGDSLIVYPYADGVINSMRGQEFFDGLQDQRALDCLAKLIGKEKTVELLEKEAGMEITFRQYPRNEEFILNWREKVNKLIKEA